MNEGLCLVVNHDVIAREEGDEGEAILFDPETERLKVVNRTGFLVWNWCDGRRTQGDLVELLSERYPSVDRQVVEADVSSFLEEMMDLELLESVASA
jgi:hypothetical protein